MYLLEIRCWVVKLKLDVSVEESNATKKEMFRVSEGEIYRACSLVGREALDGRSCDHEEANRIGLIVGSGSIFPVEWVVSMLNIKENDVRRQIWVADRKVSIRQRFHTHHHVTDLPTTFS